MVGQSTLDVTRSTRYVSIFIVETSRVVRTLVVVSRLRVIGKGIGYIGVGNSSPEPRAV